MKINPQDELFQHLRHACDIYPIHSHTLGNEQQIAHFIQKICQGQQANFTPFPPSTWISNSTLDCSFQMGNRLAAARSVEILWIQCSQDNHSTAEIYTLNRQYNITNQSHKGQRCRGLFFITEQIWNVSVMEWFAYELLE